MIHKYKYEDLNIVIDVNSGAIHLVEPVIYDILDYLNAKPTASDISNITEKLLNIYPKTDIDEGFSEISTLCDNGTLFCEDYYNEIADKLDKEPVIKALCLHIAHDCNLRCGYCFAGTGEFQGARSMMSFDVGKKAIDFVVEHSGDRKNIEIDFFGGEPLMNFDVVKQLTLYAEEIGPKKGKNFRLTLTTNGVLLDDDKIAFINEHMSNLVLSIDGRKSVNDNMRKTIAGGGSYDVILPHFKKAAESRNQENYYVRGTFTRHNLDFSEDVLHLADLGFKQISVEPVVGGADTDYALKNEDLPVILEQYDKLTKEYVKRYPTENWFNFFHFMIDLEQGPCVIKRLSGCGAGCEYVAITPDGDIYPCHQFVGEKKYCMGNVNGEYHEENADSFRKTNVYTKDDCRKCWAKFYCSGGCHANAVNFGGDINKPYKLGCELEKKRVECAIYAEICKKIQNSLD